VARCHAQARYVPRTTQDRDALALVRAHWPAFRERLEERAGSLPGFVRDELEGFITCGDFELGFLVAQCRRCGDSLRVRFACKNRGVCPSCMGRRMAETAALLVEHRLPAVPWRHWVLSFEGPMAMRLGYARRRLGRVCQRFAKRVMQTLRHQSKRDHGLRSSSELHPGVLIVVQRFRSDLGLFVHLHALFTDDCFEAPAAFMPVAGLCEQGLLWTLQRLHATCYRSAVRTPCFTLLLAVSGCQSCGTTPPAEIPWIGIAIPTSAGNYYSHESGVQSSMLQVRFDLPARDLRTLEARLPCANGRLGPTSRSAPAHALVGTNEQAWYRPEQSPVHRGCEGTTSDGDVNIHVSVLIDMQRDPHTVYIVASD